MLDLFKMLQPHIDRGVETRKIEFKREMDLHDRPKRAKLAKTISALANTEGGTGYIVIGVVDRKDRQPAAKPKDYVFGFSLDRADDFQRTVQDSLNAFVTPIPKVSLEIVHDPRVKRDLAVLVIHQSHNRPHALKQTSGDVKAGIFVKRDSHTYEATPEEVARMQDASLEKRLLLNFARPLTAAQRMELSNLLGHLPETIEPIEERLPVGFNEGASFADEAKRVVDALGLTPDEWAQMDFVVNLPGLAPAAAALLAEIHGRCGYFPQVIRLRRNGPSGSSFGVAEIIVLQSIRDRANRPTSKMP